MTEQKLLKVSKYVDFSFRQWRKENVNMIRL